MIAEIGNSDIEWMEPRDVSVGELVDRLDPQSENSLVTVHRHRTGLFSDREMQGICVLTADGAVHVLPADTPPKTLRALLTPNGGEDVSIDDVRISRPVGVERIHWNRVAALLVLVASTAIMAFRPRRGPQSPAVWALWSRRGV